MIVLSLAYKWLYNAFLEYFDNSSHVMWMTAILNANIYCHFYTISHQSYFHSKHGHVSTYTSASRVWHLPSLLARNRGLRLGELSVPGALGGRCAENLRGATSSGSGFNDTYQYQFQIDKYATYRPNR